MLIGGIFFFFLLVFVAAGYFRSGTLLPTSSSRSVSSNITGMVSNERVIIGQIDHFRDNKCGKSRLSCVSIHLVVLSDRPRKFITS
jgi:hypothetical protein